MLARVYDRFIGPWVANSLWIVLNARLTTEPAELTFGLGTEAVDEDSAFRFFKAQYANVVCYTAAAISVKFSLLFQYRRLFETERTRWFFIGFIAWLSIYSIIAMALTIFTCDPVKKYWIDELPGRCINRQLLQYFIAGFNVFNDFALLCIPIPFLRKLQIERRAKIVLMCVFACGAL